MKNAKNNHQFTIWKKVDLAYSLCFKRIELTKNVWYYISEPI